MNLPWIGPIRSVTVVSERLAESVRAYEQTLGYVKVDEGAVPDRLAESWAAPRAAGAPFVVVGPTSGIGGAVRLVEGPSEASYAPARTTGWAALEIAVPDVDALAARLQGSGFRTLVPPAALAGTVRPALRAMQCSGPSGELVYFTQIIGQLPPFDLPTSSGDIDGVFIAVVAASDLETTRSWFERSFQVIRASDREVAIQVVNHAFNLPSTTLHRISSLQLRGQTAIEHDQYPADARPRRAVAGHLPPGVASVAVACAADGDVAQDVLLGPDGLRLELVSQ